MIQCIPSLLVSQERSSLKRSLISYWKLDEASGVRADSHGSNDLSDNNTVGSSTGIINNAASFVAINTEFLSHNSNSDLQTGDIDFTLSAWVNASTLSGNTNIVAKRSLDVGSLEYVLRYDGTLQRFQMFVSPNGNVPVATVEANVLGIPSTSTWYFIVCWHDSVNNEIGIIVNNGVADTTAHSTGVFAGTAPFDIGAIDTGGEFWDGLVDEVGFWKRMLTTSEIAVLYNSGSGFSYDLFT